MRLHRLSVIAFGPFAGRETVDFDALARDGLFLLHGPTGAGKTSILDAVCFALYGSVPGARQGNPLRSDHAPPETVTEVILELTVRGHRLEITRRPTQEAPRKRGGGSRTIRAQTLLREWRAAPQPGWQARSSSHQEVGEEVQQLLGMSRDQFCQVVLLPQGDFAKFLRADAMQRSVVLGRLFNTRRYAAVEDWLAERRRSTAAATRAAAEELLGTVHRLYQAAGSNEPPPSADGADWTGLVDGVRSTAGRLRAEARATHTRSQDLLAQVERRQAAAVNDAEQVRVLAERQSRHTRARAQAAGLDQAAQEQRQLTDTVQRARRAAEVAPLLRIAEAARQEHLAATQARVEALHRLPPDLAEADERLLDRAEGDLRRELARLEELAESERQHERVARSLPRLRQELDDAEEQREDSARWLRDWPDRKAQAMDHVRRAQAAAHHADQLLAQLNAATGQLDAAKRVADLCPRIETAQAAEQAAQEEAFAAHERWLKVRERRLDGMAAELAAHLREGQPCPVCGSAAHPDPTRPAPGHVTEADEAEAETAHRVAQQAREGANRRLQELREQVAAASATAEGDTTEGDPVTVDTLRDRVARLTEDQAAAEVAAAAGVQAGAHLEQVESEHARRLTEQQQLATLIAARTARYEELSREQERLAARLETACDTDQTIADRVARLTELADTLAAAGRTMHTAREAEARSIHAREEASTAVQSMGFHSADEATEALREDARLGAMQQRIDRYREELAAVRAVLDDPDIQDAAALPPADLTAAQEKVAAATTELRQATAAEDAHRTRCADLDTLTARLTGQANRIAPLVESHLVALRLANLIAGLGSENTLRMGLESYVLAARLEQVAAAASVRLQRMSAGRYTLVHSDERSSGNKRSGLGLQVVDAWTGRTRDTATLSGGESFFASLALALGLADVVTDEAGGTRLDTLFVDEGFGSLDPQALDDVLDVLDALRERDRAVGIVSHVPELRQRIPTQLRITRGRHGSSVRTVGAGSAPPVSQGVGSPSRQRRTGVIA